MENGKNINWIRFYKEHMQSSWSTRQLNIMLYLGPLRNTDQVIYANTSWPGLMSTSKVKNIHTAVLHSYDYITLLRRGRSCFSWGLSWVLSLHALFLFFSYHRLSVVLLWSKVDGHKANPLTKFSKGKQKATGWCVKCLTGDEIAKTHWFLTSEKYFVTWSCKIYF